MLRLLFLALVGLATTYAQIPHHCFSPPELTFRARQYNHALTTFRHFHAEYDNKLERLAFDEIEETGPKPGRQYLRFIFLHRQNVAYEYNRKTKQCKKGEAGRFRPFGTPEGARFEAEFYVGGPGEEMEGVAWSDRTDFKREDWYGVFSRINCYPARIFLRNTQTNETVTTNIYDVVEGISDPSLFEPPSECLQATQEFDISDQAKALRALYTRKFN